MWNLLKDTWLLFGRLFPLPTRPGLRAVGNPDLSSPVLVTGNFELTVRKVIATLRRERIDAWLLVAPTRGINVWCAAGGGHFTTDTVVSILRTSGIEERVDHRHLILPQLAANGVNVWKLKERSGWRPRFGPVDIRHLAAYLASGRKQTERAQRRVRFPPADRLVMGTNLGFNSALLLAIPLGVASIWLPGLWWRTLPLLFALSVLASLLAFWLPGKPGVQKGVALGVLVAAPFVFLSQTAMAMAPWTTVGWTAWILLLATYTGYDLPSWSPLWRQEVKELVFGVKQTRIEVVAERCIGCHLCDIVCPAGVFAFDEASHKYAVADLDACLACGACIENCPTDAIDNNFRGGICSCPTCALIDGARALTGKRTSRPAPAIELVPIDTECRGEGCACEEEDAVSRPS